LQQPLGKRWVPRTDNRLMGVAEDEESADRSDELSSLGRGAAYAPGLCGEDDLAQSMDLHCKSLASQHSVLMCRVALRPPGGHRHNGPGRERRHHAPDPSTQCTLQEVGPPVRLFGHVCRSCGWTSCNRSVGVGNRGGVRP
jgi:hypothetical protein